MSVLDQLQESLSDFSRNERHVADYILSNPQEMRSLSGEALAAICGCARSWAIRAMPSSNMPCSMKPNTRPRPGRPMRCPPRTC